LNGNIWAPYFFHHQKPGFNVLELGNSIPNHGLNMKKNGGFNPMMDSMDQRSAGNLGFYHGTLELAVILSVSGT